MRDTFKVEIDYGVAVRQSAESVVTWKGNPLGRINEHILKSTALLYASRADAEHGGAVGATAFFVSMPIEDTSTVQANANPQLDQVYVATASHVVNQGFTTLRFIDIQGKTQILDLPKKVRNTFQDADSNSWIWNDEGNDVVVYPLEFPNRSFHAIPVSAFVTTSSQWGDVNDHLLLEVGDEVFMVGRTLALDCRNPPLVARFGKLACPEIVPVRNDSVHGSQDSHLAEMRSESGYSGAPVFISKPALNPEPSQDSVTFRDRAWFLGVNWGHLPHYDLVVGKRDDKLVSEDWRTKSNSGLATIVPSWKLFQLLHYDELKAQRRLTWSTYRAILDSGVEGVPD